MKRFSQIIQIFFLTVCFSGKAPFAPGTFGSILSFFLALLLICPLLLISSHFFISFLFFLISIVVTFITIPVIDHYEKVHQIHDPGMIVIDELVGVFIALGMILFFTTNFWILFLGLLLFRFFDIAKPWIIGMADEQISGGLGVMLDDVIGGIFAGGLSIWLYILMIFHSNVFLLQVSLSLFGVFIVIYLTNLVVKFKKTRHIIKNNIFFHPNAISYYRVPLAFISIFCFAFGYETVGILLYTLACITDYTDGIIARDCGLESEKGKSLDPFSDKIVYFVPLFYFVFLGKISFILVVIFFLIDFFGQFSRILLKKLGKETKANYFGKIKTTFVFILVFSLLLNASQAFVKVESFFSPLLIIAIVFALLSIVFKFYDLRKVIDRLKEYE